MKESTPPRHTPFLYKLGFRGALAACVATVLAASSAQSAASMSAPQTPAPGLAGTWRVTRACVLGCTGTTILTEHVGAYRNGVFLATGSVTQLLYPISARRVLVHAAKSSSFLKIVSPGRRMQGVGVGDDASTFSITWQCIAAPAAQTSGLRPLARGMC